MASGPRPLVQARLFLFFFFFSFFPRGVRFPEGLPKTLGKWPTSLLAAGRLQGVQFAEEAAVHPIPSCPIRISAALARQSNTAERLGALGPSTLSCRLRKDFSSQAGLAAGASTGSGASRYRMTHRQPHGLTWFGGLVLYAMSFVRSHSTVLQLMRTQYKSVQVVFVVVVFNVHCVCCPV